MEGERALLEASTVNIFGYTIRCCRQGRGFSIRVAHSRDYPLTLSLSVRREILRAVCLTLSRRKSESDLSRWKSTGFSRADSLPPHRGHRGNSTRSNLSLYLSISVSDAIPFRNRDNWKRLPAHGESTRNSRPTVFDPTESTEYR